MKSSSLIFPRWVRNSYPGLKSIICGVALFSLFLTGCTDNQNLISSQQEEQATSINDSTIFVLDVRAPTKEAIKQTYFSTRAKRWGKTEIAHYKFNIRLGDGPYDVVRIHRVVPMRNSFRPVRTRGAVFMTQGASLTFDAIFKEAGATNPNKETSIALYLADNNIDVWGMDFGWTQIPEETSDFSFLENWGIQRDVDHTLAAMSIARFIRGITGQGFGPMNLLGYSYGVAVAYTAAGQETQLHRIKRDIKGIIPVDLSFKTPDPFTSPNTPCEAAAGSRSQLDMGIYQDQLGINAALISQLAIDMPNQPSPLPPFEGLTNDQAALAVGTLTQGSREYWHFVSGEFNEAGIPMGLNYSNPDRWINLLGSLPPYMPIRAIYEVGATACGEVDIYTDDYLSEIRIPILYVGDGGGYGEEVFYTSTLTSSNDITNINISTIPSEPTLDFGHADLFLAKTAPERVWHPILQWITDHEKGSRWW